MNSAILFLVFTTAFLALCCVVVLAAYARAMRRLEALKPKPRLVELARKPEWTPEDADQFAAFLKSTAGQALRERMTAIVTRVCFSGCGTQINTTYAAGIGWGWKECCDKFFEHATISRVTGDQVTDNAERPEGEDELRERFSP